MHKALIALTATVLAVAPLGCASPHTAEALTPDQATVMVPVHQFVDGFNAGDAAKALAVCTDQMSIIDEFPPHEWHGAGASAKWLSDYDADAKKHGITDGRVTLGAPVHIDITADRAYVVAPADYAFMLKGQPGKETGSVFTFALQKTAAGWRITGWAWSKMQAPR